MEQPETTFPVAGALLSAALIILKGLNGKETVAITNANNLFDDMPVQIVKD